MVYFAFDQEVYTQQEVLDTTFAKQDYYTIHQSLKGSHWTDDEWGHDTEKVVGDEALKYLREEKLGIDAAFEWKRLNEIVQNPVFKKDEACSGLECDRFDILQGGGGNCWFLSAVDSISEKNILMRLVVPDDNVVDGSGIFHFRFWRYGKWIDVVIDDWLFCHVKCNGEIKLAFALNRGNEFWVPLLEKAYAKLNGSYSATLGGTPSDSLTDLTGGISKHIIIEKNPQKMYNQFVHAYESGAIICLGIGGAENEKNELVLDCGLVTTHEYALTKMGTIPWNGKEVILIRIRNPYGDNEWNGDWSDGDEKWNVFTPEQIKILGLDKTNGEFWMCYEDVIKYFWDFDVCYLEQSIARHLAQDKSMATYWNTLPIFHDEWMENDGDYLQNSQYVLHLQTKHPDDRVIVLYGITLKSVRLTWKDALKGYVKLYIFKAIEDGDSSMKPIRTLTDSRNFKNIPTGECDYYREFTEELELECGKYIIIPAYGINKGSTGAYVFRVFLKGSLKATLTKLE